MKFNYICMANPADIFIAKNYLSEDELDSLNRIVEMYLIYGENQAKRGRLMKMEDWKRKLDAFLEFNEYEILQDSGKVSAEIAKRLAEDEFKQFRVGQDRAFESDFDRVTDKYLKKS